MSSKEQKNIVEPMGELVEVTFEIDSELKAQAEKIFAEYGLTLEEATILFFKETVRLHRFPFDLDDNRQVVYHEFYPQGDTN